MKKIIVFLISMLFIPVCVNAKSQYLYDVLKNEAESNGLAREFTGTHHDSFDKEPSKKIYHWYAENNTEGNQVLEKNNVIFGGFCWQMLRTTDTGGVKLIYNGIPNEGKCNNTGASQQMTTSKFNNNNNSLADIGYMNSERITSNKKTINSVERMYEMYESIDLSTNYWYADSIIWNSSTNKYELENPYKISSTSEYSNLKGKYTFSNTSQTYTASSVKYIVTAGSSNSKCITLSSGKLLSDSINTYTYGDSYIDNGNGTYTIESPETYTTLEYSSHSSVSYQYKYFCKNAINNTCSDLWYIVYLDTSKMIYLNSSSSYKFGSSFTYENGKYTLSGETKDIWNVSDNNKGILNNYHYTCFNKTGTCDSISYVYYLLYASSVSGNEVDLYYVNLNNGKSITDATNEMLSDNNVNSNNSKVKTIIDQWYSENLNEYTEYIEDTIFCNNRKISNTSSSGWNPNGGSVKNVLFFNGTSLTCQNETDKFSLSNEKAKLTYPVGLPTQKELSLLNNSILRKTGQNYWTMSPNLDWINPNYSNKYSTKLYSVSTTGYFLDTSVDNVESMGVRPTISLKPRIKYSSGTGSKTEPYIVDLTNYYGIDVEIVNETEDLTVEIEDLSQVPEGEEVNFKVTPIKGHKLTSMKIVDVNNNEVEFTTTDNKNFTFTMPADDVIIKPSYGRVKNAVNIEDNKNTKEFVIEVNDATAVVYEDKVKFKVEPEEGYEVEKIEITDEENNNISYKKTNNINEYKFTMPDTDVLIKPYYKKIETNNHSIPNPNTKRQITFIIISILILSIITVLFVKKKKRLQ